MRKLLTPSDSLRVRKCSANRMLDVMCVVCGCRNFGSSTAIQSYIDGFGGLSMLIDSSGPTKGVEKRRGSLSTRLNCSP